jgi:hypothetical protein
VTMTAVQRATYVEQSPASEQFTPLNHDNGHLHHHHKEAVASEFLGDAAHDEFMGKR